MAYIGEQWRNKPLPNNLDFTHTYLVLVSAELPNSCGHVLLYINGGFGHYFHFCGPYIFDFPRHINGDSGYRFFLKDSRKMELMRRKVIVPNPEKAKERLTELMNKRWLWLMGSHNCASFASEVLHAGGNSSSMPRHCPAIDMGLHSFWERIFGPIRKQLGTQKQYDAHELR